MIKINLPENIIQDYEDGRTLREIAKAYKCSPATIAARLIECGVVLRLNSHKKVRSANFNYNKKIKGFCNRCQKVATDKTYCEDCKIKVKTYREERVKRGLCRHCSNIAIEGLKECLKCKNKISEQRKHLLVKLKTEVFQKYGGLKCKYCNICDLRILTVDHIHNNGAEENKSGKDIYADLKRRGYPEGYQVLCFNCNILKYRNNGVHPSEIPDDYII